MDSLKDIRDRIVSVKSTRQITSAMKMVSAAKLKKAQNEILRLRPYADKLDEINTKLSSGNENSEENIYDRKPENGKILIICVSSNKGLCGAFNSNVIRKAEELLNTIYADDFKNGKIRFSVIGKKAEEAIKSKGWEIIESNNALFDKLEYNSVAELANNYMKLYLSEEYDRIDIISNQFKSAGIQALSYEQYLPLLVEEESENSDSSDYLLEPDLEYLTKTLIPLSLKVKLYKALVDSNAAEHAARMTAMHIATDNASSIISDLRLQYNKARQASITNEILEIVGGAEALKS
jgi:F-type H+-transporting ATPase subunit gamma